MELIKDILQTIRVNGSLFFHSQLDAPWGLMLAPSNEPKIHIALNGECIVQSAGMNEPIRLQHGDVILLPDGAQHWIADSVNSPRLPSEQFCQSLEQGRPGVRTTGPSVQLLCGLIRFDRTLDHPLIGHLPVAINLACSSPENTSWLPGIIAQFESEISVKNPYSDVIVDRLFEVLFLQIIRGLVESIESPRGFWAAIRDPKINKVLTIIHERYAENLSVESLANEVYLSRSVFMDRFARLVGESPISYLTSWRMHKSIALLRGNQESIERIAEQVGYASAESFSRAFKRYFGMTPNEVRHDQ